VKVPDWRSIADSGTWIGDRSAPVVITEFSDFQCPFCRRLADSLAVLRTRYPTQVAISYRYFPIERIHPYARAAALSAACAGAQGRFESMHDALYAGRDSLGKWTWKQYARQAKVPDGPAFERCMRDSSYIGRVSADFAAGVRFKVAGTPTVLVNDVRLPGTPTLAVLDSLVRDQLRSAGPAKRD
jgi:protein-disulfide isomerase